jgi:hypothetical protein
MGLSRLFTVLCVAAIAAVYLLSPDLVKERHRQVDLVAKTAVRAPGADQCSRPTSSPASSNCATMSRFQGAYCNSVLLALERPH